MPRQKNKVISIQNLKRSNFRPPHRNHVNSDSYTETTPSSIPHIKIKSISTTHTKTKSSSMLTLKPSGLRLACKNQVNFDHPHQHQVNRSPRYKQIIFGPHEKNQSIAIPALKPSQLRSIHEDQTIIGPNTSVSTPRTRKSISIPTPKPSQYRSPTQKPT